MTIGNVRRLQPMASPCHSNCGSTLQAKLSASLSLCVEAVLVTVKLKNREKSTFETM